MPIPDPPPDPTYFRVLLSDPEGSDAKELEQILQDSGLRVLGVEELSRSEVDSLSGKKPSDNFGLPHTDRKVG